ncbi:MAG: hypothetical protein JJ909_07280 [Roseivirga sp.]|uniref:hypothetical protein n=1 Tax=Roseivirga sp. TaxID=1964215 RepID=UPI001B144A50|nr:hypothetical protein [Roseivirga sp.]MBO6495343.1 hypothetical protein [Roseivirga sp.]MBO6660462.1 hypothetical protein [Roseivirga sp.]MBO6760758.1 hypothetical protein [Roseivirga sp.]MBO6906801.1 hypothetical protein [Roseivirga sp.]
MQRISTPKIGSAICIAVLLLLSSSAFGQKVERESRIKSPEVPEKALEYIEQTSLDRVKWYRETGLESISFEAKFKLERRWYSVEFSEEGVLEDIEIEIDLHQVPEPTRESIDKYLEAEFKRHRIKKVQIQYKQTSLQTLIREEVPKTDSPHAFELVVKGKKSKLMKLWEVAFSSTGKFISIDQILNRNSTHLEY